MKKIIKISLLASVLLLGGCEWLPIHRPNIVQGNVVTANMLKTIKPGMSKEQVQFLMGTPVMQNAFEPNRIDYIYYYKPGYGKPSIRRVVLYFQGDRLMKVSPVVETGPQNTPPQVAAELSESLAPSLPSQSVANNGGLPLPFSH